MKRGFGWWTSKRAKTSMRARGSVFWNEFRRRWVMILSGHAGEIWFTEADTPVGAYARRVVTHERYNFYNPTQHPFFDQEGGRLIYFEGTYTASFSGATEKTPRYDYNQIMYRLALDDPRLSLPAAMYRVPDARGSEQLLWREDTMAERTWPRAREIAFFALPPDRNCPGAIPIYAFKDGAGSRLSTDRPANEDAVLLFQALPPTDSVSATSVGGLWDGTATAEDDSEIPLTLNLKANGEEVSGNAGDGTSVRNGRWSQGTLRLELVSGGKSARWKELQRTASLPVRGADQRRT